MNTVEDILWRLRWLYEVKTDIDLATALKIPYKTLVGWKTRKSVPVKRIQEFAERDSFNPKWVIAGEGKWDDEFAQLKEEKSSVLEKIRTSSKLSGNIPIKYFENVTASAGYGSNNSDESFEELSVGVHFLRSVLQISPVKHGYDMIKVCGDSMEPFVQDGDIVVIDRHTEAKNGDVVIANLGEDLFIKKFLRDSLHGSVKLTSLNAHYQDIVLRGDEIEELKVIGKVVCKFSINMKVF